MRIGSRLFSLYGYCPRGKRPKPAGRTVAVTGRPTKAQFADRLRRNTTPAEQRLWIELKPHGFMAQQIVRGYIPDFFHPGRRLIVEVDGGVHADQQEYDEQREDRLKAAGYRIVRVSNLDVFTALDKVCKMLLT